METKICTSCKQQKSKTEFTKNKARRDGLNHSCRDCHKRYQAQHYKKNKTQYIERNRQAEKRWKALIDDLKSVPCADCGKTYPPYVMDFDHVRGTKKFNLSIAKRVRSERRIREEIAKCDVVCANCHRIRTHAPA